MEPRAAPKWGFGTTVFAEETKRDRRGADLAEFWHRNRPKVWILDGFGTIEAGFSINSVYLLAQSNCQSLKIAGFRLRFWVQYFDCLPLRIGTWRRLSIRKIISASRRIFCDRFQQF